MDIFGLEDNLPDELVSTNNWSEQLGGNKPPAQGPGPGGNQHINGEDQSVLQQRLQQQMQMQIMQQQHHQQQVITPFHPNIQSSAVTTHTSIHSLTLQFNFVFRFFSFLLVASQGNKNPLLSNVNAMGMNQLGNKSPNLQSPPQSNLPNNLGMNSMAMSIANNGPQAMGSMQGKCQSQILCIDFFPNSGKVGKGSIEISVHRHRAAATF